MSEKNLWKWLNKKMGDGYGWQSVRIECSITKGIPDSFIKFSFCGIEYTGFVELKDWSGSERHPLLTEQYNFIRDFGGAIIIRTSDGIALCNKENSHNVKEKSLTGCKFFYNPVEVEEILTFLSQHLSIASNQKCPRKG